MSCFGEIESVVRDTIDAIYEDFVHSKGVVWQK